MARLDPIPPDQLDLEQRALYDEMEPMIAEHLKGFVSHRGDGALVGPFASMLHFPAWGEGAWRQTRSLMDHTGLPKAAHEVAILVTGAALGARYELYAHQAVAEQTDLTPAKIATIAAGERPADLTAQEGTAYDVAATLMRGGPLPEATYHAALDAFGQEGLAELVFLIGGYSLVSVLLNAYDVPVPGAGDGS